ncbi:MAG: DNA polymerase I [Candidatus Doudnabacteria bacterium]|nr:DNA polymerase I [Candidatus Doudnabacteria bacterium]
MTTPKTPRYMLVDGNALIHRGYHAIPVLNTKSGEQTNAVYGFTTILLRAIKDIKPTHIACTFDLKGPTFRHLQYKEYKGTRVKTDQELYDQIPRVKEVVRGLNISIYEKEGFEADDLLGTLAVKIHKDDPEAEVIIVTGDLDTLQLVNHKIRVYTMRKGITDTVIYDARAVRERYGLAPEQMVDYKALRGDPSDNIPGVTGIGEKTAAGLIKDFGSFENLYKEIKSGKAEGKIKARVLELLKTQEEQAIMSHQLSKIDCAVPVEINLPQYDLDSSHLQTTVKLFQTLEFRSLINKLPKTESQSIGESESKKQNKEDIQTDVVLSDIGKQDYIFVDTESKLGDMLKELSKAKELCVDTETTGLDPWQSELVGVGLCALPGRAFYVPAKLAGASQELKDLLANEKIKKIGHNIKFDLEVLQANGYKLGAISFDTMIASYLLNSATRQHNLDALAFNELGYQMQPIDDLIGKGKKQITMDQVDPAKVSWYCCEDVDMTLRLKELFEPKVKAEGLLKIFDDIEMPLAEVLGGMEKNGIKLDVKFLNRLSGEVEIDLKQAESDIYKLCGQEFNINSPKQLKEILFDKLKLEPIENRKTKTGLSTAAGELEKMMGQHPVIPKIMQYRELAKLQSTYLLALPELVNKKTGRLHTNYNQTIAATGRLSSTDPNLQNIPVRGEGAGSKIRQAFVAEKGYKLLSIDYSQIELRIVAHLAGDKKMLDVFKRGEDIHTKTAMEIFGVSKDQVTKDMRRDAKTINFGILYGLSSFGLSARIGEVSRVEAKQFIAKYFAAYPAVESYIEQVKLQVNEEAFVKNELGRIRRFPEIRSSQFFIRAAAERAAVNFPIQSLAADVIKVAMINIFKEIEKSGNSEIKMLLQVHDELVFEVKEDKVDYWVKQLIPLMESAIKLSVPITVEAKVGDNWGEMEATKL